MIGSIVSTDNVVGNQNGKELMTDSRIITLVSKDQRIVAPANKSKAGALKIEQRAYSGCEGTLPMDAPKLSAQEQESEQ